MSHWVASQSQHQDDLSLKLRRCVHTVAFQGKMTPTLAHLMPLGAECARPLELFATDVKPLATPVKLVATRA